MPTDPNIYRAAKLYVDLYGRAATKHAAMRADACLNTCDMEGRTVWLRVVKAVEELQAKGRPEGVGVH